jgi:hypothetical protein
MRIIMNLPICEKCGGRTYVSRREPHPTLGALHELQTLRCASCEHQQARDQDVNGPPAGLNDLAAV